MNLTVEYPSSWKSIVQTVQPRVITNREIDRSRDDRRFHGAWHRFVASPPNLPSSSLRRDVQSKTFRSVMEVMRARAWLRSATTGVIERGVFFLSFPSPPRVATTTSLGSTRDRKLSISSGADDIEPRDRDLYRLPRNRPPNQTGCPLQR